MNKKQKQEMLKQRLTSLKNCLEISKECIDSALISLNRFDEFNDLVNNWDKYKEIFTK
ncbi:MAG: hypothetical protein PHC34_03385 [Candidatus Gastranaerophilales bacterium]|nr:hypothetical protein [Candidatus Gastranaerophilales bacterium]